MGAEGLGSIELERHRIHGHHGRGAGEDGALHGVHPDAADAVDDDDVARADLGHVDRSAPTSRDTAGEQARHLERHVVVDLDDRTLGDDGPLGERAEHAHAADVLTVDVEAERAVGQLAGGDGGAEVAQVRTAGEAPAAVPTRRQERGDHVVALGDGRDARSDRLDHAGTLMATDERQPRPGTVAHVLVGVAEPGVLDAQQHLAAAGRVELHLSDLPVAPGFEEHRGVRLHGMHLSRTSVNRALNRRPGGAGRSPAHSRGGA